MNDEQNTKYIAGVCNINPIEVQRRRKAGYAGLLAAICMILASLFVDWGIITTFLIVAVTSFIASLGLLQARENFCAQYALQGKQHAETQPQKDVLSLSEKQLDRTKAFKIIGKSFVISLTVAGLVMLVLQIF